MNATQKLHDAGQSLWLDNITRALLTSGTLARYIDDFSVTGLTSNPTIFDQAIKGSADYDTAITRAKRAGKTLDGSYAAVIDVTDAVGTATVSLPFLLDAHPPVVKLASRPIRLWVSEAATVAVRVNGALRRLQSPGPGYLALTGIRKVKSIVVVARDPAGNKTVFRRP